MTERPQHAELFLTAFIESTNLIDQSTHTNEQIASYRKLEQIFHLRESSPGALKDGRRINMALFILFACLIEITLKPIDGTLFSIAIILSIIHLIYNCYYNTSTLQEYFPAKTPTPLSTAMSQLIQSYPTNYELQNTADIFAPPTYEDHQVLDL